MLRSFLPTRRDWIWMVLLALALGWPLLVYPLGLDQGIYAVNAARMLRGMALYSQAWDMKSPGIFFMYALPIAVFGFQVWPIQLLHIVLHTLAGAALFVMGRRAFGRNYAWTIFAVYLIIAFGWGNPITNGQPDDWLLPFFLWAIALMVEAWRAERQPRRFAFIAGLCMGWVLILRPTMLFAVVLLPLMWLGIPFPRQEDEHWTKRLRARTGAALRLTIFYIAGGLAIGAITLLYFAATGSMKDLLFTQLDWNRQYAQTESPWNNLDFELIKHNFKVRWDWYFDEWNELTWSIPLGVGALLIRRLRRRPVQWWTLALWGWSLLLGFSSMLIQLKFFNYHWWPVVAFLSAPMALLIVEAASLWLLMWRRAAQANSNKERMGLMGGCVVVAVATILWIGNEETGARKFRKRYKQTVQFVIGDESRSHFYGRFDYFFIYRPFEDFYLSKLIRERNVREEPPRLFVWGFRPAIYFECGTVGPSRFPYNLPLRAQWSPPEWLGALEGEVMKTPPDFICVAINDRFQWVTGRPESSREIMPAWLRHELRNNFVSIARMKHMELFERKGVNSMALGPTIYEDTPEQSDHLLP